jgi:hypothetical protein
MKKEHGAVEKEALEESLHNISYQTLRVYHFRFHSKPNRAVRRIAVVF